jgi:hypothetical protein
MNNLLNLVTEALRGSELNIEELNSSNSGFKTTTIRISKDFKNASNYEVEAWANTIDKILDTYSYIEKNCSANFRITNDGNEKWKTGNFYLWEK